VTRLVWRAWLGWRAPRNGTAGTWVSLESVPAGEAVPAVPPWRGPALRERRPVAVWVWVPPNPSPLLLGVKLSRLARDLERELVVRWIG
jgi:hypothetical protein